MANPLTDVIAATQAALSQLLADLKSAGATDLAAMQSFANSYAPTASAWGISLATAVITGDAASVDRYKADLADLAALAAGTAADLAVLGEGTIEADIQKFVNGALVGAAKAALSSLIAV